MNLEKKEKRFAVDVTGLSYVYQEGTKALSDINFKVREGSFVALLASNGSGKTTLIKNITGLLRPQQGNILLGGDNIKDILGKELYQRIGVTFQNPDDQLFCATVEEDVSFGPGNFGLDDDEIEKRVVESLEMVSASHLRKKAIHHLSFGQKKRVAIAGVLAMRPSVLLLDEPTAGLDPEGESSLMLLLKELNRKHGITVILATHSIDVLPLFADSIYILRHGAVLKHGSTQDILTDHDILQEAGLRMPYVSLLLHQMKHRDGLPVNDLPLTIGEARKHFLDLIPEEIFLNTLENKK